MQVRPPTMKCRPMRAWHNAPRFGSAVVRPLTDFSGRCDYEGAMIRMLDGQAAFFVCRNGPGAVVVRVAGTNRVLPRARWEALVPVQPPVWSELAKNGPARSTVTADETAPEGGAVSSSVAA